MFTILALSFSWIDVTGFKFRSLTETYQIEVKYNIITIIYPLAFIL